MSVLFSVPCLFIYKIICRKCHHKIVCLSFYKVHIHRFTCLKHNILQFRIPQEILAYRYICVQRHWDWLCCMHPFKHCTAMNIYSYRKVWCHWSTIHFFDIFQNLPYGFIYFFLRNFISNQIDFQGLRKSGQMHKVRLSKNNYQLVAESSGQSPEVLMSNYNEALDPEKRNLSQLVEEDLYPGQEQDTHSDPGEVIGENLLERIRTDPAFSKQLLQLLLDNAQKAV